MRVKDVEMRFQVDELEAVTFLIATSFVHGDPAAPKVSPVSRLQLRVELGSTLN